MNNFVYDLEVPGNILITGEYLITMQGGLGLSMAVLPYIKAKSKKSEAWCIHSIMGNKTEDNNSLMMCVFTEAEKVFKELNIKTSPLEITIDTSSCFDSTGRKLGFGSSASSSVALSLILCRAFLGLDNASFNEIASGIALRGHRCFQGGSGYDVLTSFYGGVGKFTGGIEPRFERIDRKLEDVYVFSGEKAVSSKDAVKKFNTWKNENKQSSLEILKMYNDSVQNVCNAKSYNDFLKALSVAKAYGIKIGELISVSALINEDSSIHNMLIKASGAGNELGLAFCNEHNFYVNNCSIAKKLYCSEGPRWIV